MPYIEPRIREHIDLDIDRVIDQVNHNTSGDERDGVANYTITRILCGIFRPATGRWRYFAIARALGCLVCVGLEFYRRVGHNLEDAAITKNGDLAEYVQDK